MFDTKEDRKKMEGIIERFKNEMKKVRTGRAHPDMLAGIKVEVYGQMMPLNQISNITASDATLLVITPLTQPISNQSWRQFVMTNHWV